MDGQTGGWTDRRKGGRTYGGGGVIGTDNLRIPHPMSLKLSSSVVENRKDILGTC